MPDAEITQKPENEDVTPVTPETETTTENETEGANSEAIELVNKYAPGSDTSTPEAIISGLVSALNKLTPFQDKIRDVVDENTEAASFVYDMLETGDVLKSLARNYSAEELQTVLDGMQDDDYEGDRKIHSDNVAASKKRKEELSANMKLSEVSAGQFMDQVNMSDADIDEFEKYYKEFLSDAVNNKMTVAHWKTLWDGMRHDPDVAEAEANGKIIGKNEKITTKKASDKDLAKLLPDGGGSLAPAAPVAKPNPLISTGSPLKKLNI